MLPVVAVAALVYGGYKLLKGDSDDGAYDDSDDNNEEQHEALIKEHREAQNKSIRKKIEAYKKAQVLNMKAQYGCDILFMDDDSEAMIVLEDHTKKQLNADIRKKRKEISQLKRALEELKEIKNEASK